MGFWTDDRDEMLRTMRGEGATFREIAEAIGLSHVSVARRVRVLGLDLIKVSIRPVGSHLAAYKSARRGFHVPDHLEAQYFELIKSGVPIAEACQRLGINSHAI